MRRNTRLDGEVVAMQLQPEDILYPQPVEPACRPRVPGPPAPPQMLRVRIDVSSNNIRLYLVLGGLSIVCTVPSRPSTVHRRMVDWVKLSEEPISPVAIAHEHAGDRSPDGGMGVLPAVLAYA